MKGILLAGGNGTRLSPLTSVTNKHLLPVYNQQMIMYPLGTLLRSGVDDVLIVTGKEHAGHFIELLGSGVGTCKFTYKVQESAGGIAHALRLAKDFIGDSNDPFVVILGDNIYADDLDFDLDGFYAAKIFIKYIGDDAVRFGVVRFSDDGSVHIVEKPKDAPSGFAVTGCYVYRKDVFDIIDTLVPSYRGELEITDVNNRYAGENTLKIVKIHSFWSDAGTFDSLMASARWAQNKKKYTDYD
jgi:glucose-1-phosphate thymidylyltransferase